MWELFFRLAYFLTGYVIEPQAQMCEQVEGRLMGEIPFAIAKDSPANTAGSYGRDTNGQSVEGRCQGGLGDEKGRSTQQAKSCQQGQQADNCQQEKMTGAQQ